MPTDMLQTPIMYLKGVGPGRAELLGRELGIATYQDLLYHFPNRFLDKSRYYRISELQASSAEVQVIGKIVHLKTIAQKKGKRLIATFRDESGEMELVWFRSQQWFMDRLELGEPYVAFGRVNRFGSTWSMAHPDLELLKKHRQKKQLRMQPIYPSTEKLSKQGVTNRVLANCVAELLKQVLETLPENLPQNLRTELGLVGKQNALVQAHFPDSTNNLARAQARLKFEELFYIQLALLRKNASRKKRIKGFVFEHVVEAFRNFYAQALPSELTEAQKRVLREIRSDLGSGAQMNRLLQGDVGSGKTIVAVLTILLALDNDYQASLVAPTEILAQQHYRAISDLLEPLGISVALLTGSVKEKDRNAILQSLIDGRLSILIGTHAVLEDRVKFRNLGLAIIDEQHRFGVAQRAKLWKKNTSPPHILVMTDTPIPRTLAMSLYGDLDVSNIDELPPGRKPVRTVH